MFSLHQSPRAHLSAPCLLNFRSPSLTVNPPAHFSLCLELGIFNFFRSANRYNTSLPWFCPDFGSGDFLRHFLILWQNLPHLIQMWLSINLWWWRRWRGCKYLLNYKALASSSLSPLSLALLPTKALRDSSCWPIKGKFWEETNRIIPYQMIWEATFISQ